MPELSQLSVGLLCVFIQHTSAGLTLNENASPDVRRDFAAWFDRAVPDGADYFSHTLEGPEDMPAHVKASLVGNSVTIPVADGRPGARHLAGHLPVRVPKRRRAAPSRGHRAGRVVRLICEHMFVSCAGTT